MPRLHHVNLSGRAEPSRREALRDWLVEVLGYTPVALSPAAIARGACRLEGEDGLEVHLSADAEHRPAARTHVAVQFNDLEALQRRLDSHSIAYERIEVETGHILTCRDPPGNRWELLEANYGAALGKVRPRRSMHRTSASPASPSHSDPPRRTTT
ncbi:MAG TPA: VOC family protein [Acidimicrobiales bacterium]|nr:VOC family protein [Acidimicrobiales bacterium]